MPRISGTLSHVTGDPDMVTSIGVAAVKVRPGKGGIITSSPKIFKVENGQVSFPCEPGEAVLTLHYLNSAVEAVPILVANVSSQTLENAVRAAGLTDTSTKSELEALAQQVLEMVSSSASDRQRAEQAAQSARADAKQVQENTTQVRADAESSATNAEAAKDSADIAVATSDAWESLAQKVAQSPSLSTVTAVSFGAAAALGGGAGGARRWDDSKPITLWGDSGIDRGDPGQRMADGLKNVLRQDVVENAVGGSTIDNALLRMGGIRLWATPEGGKIPATTSPVMLNLHGADVGMMSKGKVPMTYAGVEGTFEYSNTVGGAGFVGGRFTRDKAGIPVTVKSPTLLRSTTKFDPYATHIIVSGGNDRRATVKTLPEDDLRGHLVAGYVRMVEMIAASPTKHVLIGGVKGRADTEIGDWYHRVILEVNNWLKQLYPHIFVDRNRWLCEHAPRLLNLNLSDEDKRRAEAWLPPKAVLQDATHTVPELRVIEGEKLWAPELAIRGWAQAKKPLVRASMDITNRVPYDMQARIDDLEKRLKALEA